MDENERLDLLTHAVMDIKEELLTSLHDAGFKGETINSAFTNILKQAHMATYLAKSEKIEEENSHHIVFMALSQSLSVLEHMLAAQEQYNKITHTTVEQAMQNSPAYNQAVGQVPKEQLDSICNYIISEAIPSIINFGGACKVADTEYELTEQGKEAAEVWRTVNLF